MQDLIYAILLAAVCWLCYHWGRVTAARDLALLLRLGELGDLLADKPAASDTDTLQLEQTAEGIFAYGQGGQFVAWGPDWPQLLDQLEIRCRNSTVKLDLTDLDLKPEELARVTNLIEKKFNNDPT
jgi:hypothetical protein